MPSPCALCDLPMASDSDSDQRASPKLEFPGKAKWVG